MTQEILVVDDSRTVRTVVEWVFHGSPYSIRAVGTASEAIRAARESRPVVILVDYALPDQSGFELCEDIRRDPALTSVPILMLGGTWSHFDEARVAACGADDFIYKPFKTDALIEKVTGIVARGKARPVVLTPADPVPHVRAVPPLPGAQIRPMGAPGAGARGTPAAALQAGPPPLPGRAPQPAASRGIPPVESHQPIATPQRMPAPQPIAAAPEPIAMGQPLPAPAPIVGSEPLPLPSPIREARPVAAPQPVPAPVAPAGLPDQRSGEITADVPVGASASGANVPVAAAAAIQVDPELLEQVVRKLLPPIVKEVLAGLLRQTIGARVESYATSKIDAFVEQELPGLAENAIEAKLAEFTGE